MRKAKYIHHPMSNVEEKVTILAVTEGWQQDCWNHARKREAFAVEQINPRLHKNFCDAVCRRYRYRMTARLRRAEFIPLKSDREG